VAKGGAPPGLHRSGDRGYDLPSSQIRNSRVEFGTCNGLCRFEAREEGVLLAVCQESSQVAEQVRLSFVVAYSGKYITNSLGVTYVYANV